MDYEEAETLIKSIEEGTSEQRVVTINLNKVFESPIVITEYDTKEIQKTVDNIDSMTGFELQKPGAQAQGKGAAKQKQQSPLQFMQKASPKPPTRQPQPQEAQFQAAPAAATPKATGNALGDVMGFSKKELGGVAGELRAKFKPMHQQNKTQVVEPTPQPQQSKPQPPQAAPAAQKPVQQAPAPKPQQPRPQPQASQQAPPAPPPPKPQASGPSFFRAMPPQESKPQTPAPKPQPPPKSIDIEDMVLPKLSLSDQLSELEKIEVGIDSGSFSKEELNIISSEIRYLYASESLGSRVAGADSGLLELRDKRLKEIINKLTL
ncbi:MAG: hypothetical protein KGH72_01845 [Candidatus Micrarchaeota archaeon]|nr:hypothetical protein [Candidatus Micrarchaeota archaeon]